MKQETKEKNLCCLVPTNELNKRYLRMFRESMPNIGENPVQIHPSEYHRQWYGDYIQIELRETVYNQRKTVFDKMGMIVCESSEAFLKKFPHPNIETDGDIFI